MAKPKSTSSELLIRALALTSNEGSDVLTSKLGMQLAALPAYQDFIREWLSPDWQNDHQSKDESGIVLGVGMLFAAGVLYGRLFSGTSTPFLTEAIDLPTAVIQ